MVNICCLIYYFTCIFKVISDHYKDKEENVEAHWELGIFFYEHCTRNKSAFKIKDDEWWYVQEFEVVCRMAKPKEEKLSGKHKIFFFNDIPVDS